MRTRLNRFRSAGLSASLVLVLTACGGGGDGGGDTPTIAAPPTTVTGTVAKGLVMQAKVLVCRIVNGTPDLDASCGAGITGSDGSYSVTLGDGFTGPAMVKVMATASSMMLDETTGIAIPYDMTMRYDVPAMSARTIAHVTPFSEMVVSGVGTTGIDADQINRMAAGVQQLTAIFGIDLTVRPVIDLQGSGSDPVTLGKQANMVKQLARVTMVAKNSDLLSGDGVACNAPERSTTKQVDCVAGFMSLAMSHGALPAAGNVARFGQAMLTQNPTSVSMPIIRQDGTLVFEVADMTSSASMESAMLKAGMPPSVVTGTVQAMMLQMH
jgi:hypothetical protein